MQVSESDSGQLFHRYQYITSHGKKRAWRQVEGKELSATSACAGIEKLKAAKQFMEAVGEPSAEQGASSGESPEAAALAEVLVPFRHCTRSIAHMHASEDTPPVPCAFYISTN